jgi:5-formyltetrahydrofolate cyclo-ligase
MNNSTSIKKSELRNEFKRIRSQLPVDVRKEASERVCDHIWKWKIFQNATVILAYMAMGSELDLSPLFKKQPKKIWAIPRVQQGGRMSFHVYDPRTLTRHALGMLEPEDTCTPVHPRGADLTLVPGLAFTLNGWRLGYGGGYYDRFLSDYEGSVAGVTYQRLISPEIPHASHDVRMQFIITENGIFPTSP